MFFSYLKRHYKIIILLCAFVGIFAGVFTLYELPVEAVGYACALCAAVGAVLFVIGYGGYARRHRELVRALKTVSVSPECLPPPHGRLEEDYQALIRALWEEKARAVSASETEKREMSDYYTMWVHQIKTPIAAAGLLLQLPGETDTAALSVQLMEIQRYAEMTLTYVRASGGGSDYVLRRCALPGIVLAAVRKYARMFILKDMAPEVEVGELTVLTDEKWLSFVVEQLLSNAVKYSPRGGRIRVYTDGRSLCVRDWGMGVRAEDLPRVFEKSFTGYNGREDKKSTGLGLYLCKKVCDNLGHGITMTSAPGQGSCVRITFGADELVTE